MVRKPRTPRNTVKPATYPYGLGPTVCDHIGHEDLAYLAGLIDGEGCITSSYPKSRERPLMLKLGMIHRPTIEWVKMVVGGGVTAHRTNQKPARQSWTWQLNGIRAYALLSRLLPYMKTKAAEAAVACLIGETFFVNQVRGKVVAEVHEKRALLGQELRDLKRCEWVA